MILSKIVLTLNITKEVKETFMNYKGVAKSKFMQRLRDEEAKYMKDLQDRLLQLL